MSQGLKATSINRGFATTEQGAEKAVYKKQFILSFRAERGISLRFNLMKRVRDLDLSPFVRQPDKRQYSANGGQAHGIVSTEVHEGI